ncbi:MAG: BREX-3 system phosphatase PglZ [Chloroflexi bacterium]|nr:BREX-3 system phosphatase PglZ [Chloroflexota bacterium]
MISSWRSALLRKFVPGLNQPTLAHDPDHLLADELMARVLSERGFMLLEYDDPIAFRWRYESEWRASLERGQGGDLIVITIDREPEALPWDLVRDGRIVTLELAEAFPQLHPAVLRELDAAALDVLYDPRAVASASSPMLSEVRTREHVLQRVYGFDVAALEDEAALLRARLRLHMRGQRMPRVLAATLAQSIAARPALREWPIVELVVDAAAFLEFLQERWPIFLRASSGVVSEVREPYGLRRPGPALLPFDDVDVRVYIDDLFHEGRLMPVALLPGRGDGLARWMRFGVLVDADAELRARAERLIDAAHAALPAADARHDAWAAFAQRRAEAASVDPEHAALIELDDVADRAFVIWLERYYGGLASLSPARPVLVSHVARHLARQIEAQPRQRAALIVVDGLALEQWCALREIMNARDARLRFEESALFAWIPTLTSVSRQAIFAWENHAVSPGQVRHARSLGRGAAADELRVLLDADPRVLGLVVDVVDGIMHGMQLGAAGMRSQVRQWAERGYMNDAVDLLLGRGYRVWLTADHGNAACRGAGVAGDGVWAEKRGARVRVYRAPELRAHAARGRVHVGEWTPPGLPSDFHPLFADGSSAFATAGEMLVGHGGRSVREVIVPFVEVVRA